MDHNCIHVQMREEELLRLEAVTRSVGIPLLIARSYGLMGYVRVGWAQARTFDPPQCCRVLQCSLAGLQPV